MCNFPAIKSASWQRCCLRRRRSRWRIHPWAQIIPHEIGKMVSPSLCSIKREEETYPSIRERNRYGNRKYDTCWRVRMARHGGSSTAGITYKCNYSRINGIKSATWCSIHPFSDRVFQPFFVVPTGCFNHFLLYRQDVSTTFSYTDRMFQPLFCYTNRMFQPLFCYANRMFQSFFVTPTGCFNHFSVIPTRCFSHFLLYWQDVSVIFCYTDRMFQ